MDKKILVGIVMGSDSDLEVMKETAQILDKFGIGYVIDVMGISMAKIATQVMLGEKLKDIIPTHKKEISHIGVKEAVGMKLPTEGAVLISVADRDKIYSGIS